MNEKLIKGIKKAISDCGVMDNNDYLQKLLALCNSEQMEMWNNMYPNGVKNLEWGIKQVENGLKALELRGISKEFESYKKQVEEDIYALKRQICALEEALEEARGDMEKLSNPIAIENVDVQKRIEKLYALEAAGVDNWDGCDYAMNRIFDE